MQAYTVASGIVIDRGHLLMVQNKRRNGSLDWSTPGGVVDPGESVLEALSREVNEETALTVHGWSSIFYAVEASFPHRDITLRAEVYCAHSYAGELVIDDPDNVVVDGRWVAAAEVAPLLVSSPRWVSEPLQHILAELFVGDAPDRLAAPAQPATWRYTVGEAPVPRADDPTKLKRGSDELRVVLLDGPGA